MKNIFQMEGKECKDQERLKMCRQISCQNEGDALAWNRQLCVGRWQWTKRGLWQPRKIQLGKREAEKQTRLLRARGSAELGK